MWCQGGLALAVDGTGRRLVRLGCSGACGWLAGPGVGQRMSLLGVGAAVGRWWADAGRPEAALAGSRFGKMLRRWGPGCTRPCTGEHTWSISAPETR